MSQLVELRKLLVGSQTTKGRVIVIANGMLRVATPGGLVEVPAEPGIGIGDDVLITNGRAACMSTRADVPVFQV